MAYTRECIHLNGVCTYKHISPAYACLWACVCVCVRLWPLANADAEPIRHRCVANCMHKVFLSRCCCVLFWFWFVLLWLYYRNIYHQLNGQCMLICNIRMSLCAGWASVHCIVYASMTSNCSLWCVNNVVMLQTYLCIGRKRRHVKWLAVIAAVNIIERSDG